MRITSFASFASGLSAFGCVLLLGGAAFGQSSGSETVCNDGLDNDGDTVVDCGDADCKGDPVCQSDGGDESTESRCSDWVDNDGNGHIDCDDPGCLAAGVEVCKGSWDKADVQAEAQPRVRDVKLGAGQTVEDLIGKFGDADGERNNFLCSDGVDNDGDGAIDCEDFGCRFDPQVNVCRDNPGVRFSVVSQITGDYDFIEKQADARFTALQLRAFGPMPFITDSFFLISTRWEKTPRMTFAMFQVPIGGGHYMNINSGSGGLSQALIKSAAKQLLVEQPYYLYNAFDQGTGAAVEFGGPVTDNGRLEYRAFLGGGSGRFNGNVGGRYFTYDNENFTWSAGVQLHWMIKGFINRWDNPMLYVQTPFATSLTLGVKYDQRAQERYPATNLQWTARGGRFIFLAEGYLKREMEFESWQGAYNVQLGFLAIPKHLLFAADFGQFHASDMENAPSVEETDIRRIRNETQFRVAAHWYFWRNIGVLSAVYKYDVLSAENPGEKDEIDSQLRLVAQYRF